MNSQTYLVINGILSNGGSSCYIFEYTVRGVALEKARDLIKTGAKNVTVLFVTTVAHSETTTLLKVID